MLLYVLVTCIRKFDTVIHSQSSDSNKVKLVVLGLFILQFSQVLSCFAQGMNNVQVPLNLKLWRTTGCHELLASLGFDLIGVGKDEVMLRSGKANSRRAVQCTVQALCALTGKDINYIENNTWARGDIYI